MESTLYIIGNGFDIAHGLKTRWADFKDFLIKNDERLFKQIEDLFKRSELWNDFETALSCPNEETLNTIKRLFNIDIAGVIKNNLTEDLKRWANKNSFQGIEKLEKFIFDDNDCFITFNYTLTLENLYDISKENIVHIHGNVDFFFDEKVELLFGHDNVNSNSSDIAINFSNFFKKDTRLILNKNKEKINKFLKRNLKRVVIVGMSYSRIDINYFKYIRENLRENIIRELHYFTDNDYNRLIEYIAELKIKEYEIIRDY